MNIFKKTKKLKQKHLHELALLCGSAAALLVVAVFIAAGGMNKVSTLLALNKIVSPSQIAGLVTVYVNVTANETTVQPGTQAVITWASYNADNCWLYSLYQPSGAIPEEPGGNPYAQTGIAAPQGSYGTGAMSVDYSAVNYYYVVGCLNMGGSNSGQNWCGTNEGQCPPATPSGGAAITFLPYTPPSFSYFTPSPSSINSGSSATLSWSATASNRGSTTGMYLDGGAFGSYTSEPFSGSANTGPLYSSTNYQMYMTDSHYGTIVSNVVTVSVAAPPTASLSQDQSTTALNANWNVYWSSTGSISSCGLAVTNPSNSTQSYSESGNGSGSFNGSQAGTYEFQYACYASSGGSSNTATLYHTVTGGSCSNGLNYSSYPSCTCPTNYVQSGSSCVYSPPPAAPSGSFSASPSSGTSPLTSTLSWSITPGPDTYAAEIYNSNAGTWTTGLPLSGSQSTGALTTSTTYALYANDSYYGAYPIWQTTVTVSGSSSCTPNWSCSGFGSCNAGTQTQTCTDLNSCGTSSGEPALTQSCTVTQCSNATPGGATGTYPSCICNNAGTYNSSSNTCTVSAPSGGVVGQIANFLANPSRVQKGRSTTLTWSTTGMASCSITNNNGTVLSTALSSTGVAETINAKTIFTLSCTDTNSNVIPPESITVNVVPVTTEI